MSPKRDTGSLNQNRHSKSHSLITVYTIRKRQMGIHKIQFVFLVSNSVIQRKPSDIRMRSTVCTFNFYRFYQDYNTESQSVLLPSRLPRSSFFQYIYMWNPVMFYLYKVSYLRSFAMTNDHIAAIHKRPRFYCPSNSRFVYLLLQQKKMTFKKRLNFAFTKH